MEELVRVEEKTRVRPQVLRSSPAMALAQMRSASPFWPLHFLWSNSSPTNTEVVIVGGTIIHKLTIQTFLALRRLGESLRHATEPRSSPTTMMGCTGLKVM